MKWMGETCLFFESLIQECREWLRRRWVVNVCHTYREGNKMADYMAKRALNVQQGVLQRWNGPPEDLMPWLEQDVDGCGLERIISF